MGRLLPIAGFIVAIGLGTLIGPGAADAANCAAGRFTGNAAALSGWSAPSGMTTSGNPWPRADWMVLKPPWVTTRSQYGSSSVCGT